MQCLTFLYFDKLIIGIEVVWSAFSYSSDFKNRLYHVNPTELIMPIDGLNQGCLDSIKYGIYRIMIQSPRGLKRIAALLTSGSAKGMHCQAPRNRGAAGAIAPTFFRK